MTTTFTLLVVPDGKAILTTTDELRPEQLAVLREHIAGWRDGEWPVVVIPSCEVVQVATIDIDLGEAVH